MKKLIIFFGIFFLFCGSVHPQFTQAPPQRITDGNFDRNPSFRIKASSYEPITFFNEFLAFERGNASDNNSNIIVQELNYSGPTNNYFLITNDNFNNRNPSIAYYIYFNINHTFNKALLLWETNRNGNYDIYASKFLNGVWSDPFPIDSGIGDQRNAKVIAIDSTIYAVTYQSGDDIFYLQYNFITNQISQKTNITSNEPEVCSNSHISISYNSFIFITYEKEISPERKGVYYRQGTINSMPSIGNASDTIAFSGNNRNGGFTFIQNLEAVFESDRSGPSNIYMTNLSNFTQSSTLIQNSFFNYSYNGVEIMITNERNSNLIFSYLRKSLFNTRFVLRHGGWFPWSDSVSIIASNNSNFSPTSTMSNWIVSPQSLNCYRHWFLYTKDTSIAGNPSLIYGTFFTNCLSDISNNNSEITNFSLSQNFPNPFNPTTNIKFSLLSSQFTKLKVYNSLGQEVTTLVNQHLQPGSYEYSFDGGGLASGVYFYRLEAGEFLETKKFVLLK